MITASHLYKTYGSGAAAVHALDDVSLTVADGEIFGVIGQSGAGKSTLLRTINALERPDRGSVVVGDREITALTGSALRAARHEIGMVFQHFNLVGNRTVQQNVEFALEAVGVRGRERSSRARDMLDLVGLADRGGHYPAQLSGGQKQRVGIARALAGEPKVLLSDEATSALDPATTRSILELFRRINRELGLTVLLITHEMDVVKGVCDSAALMEHGRILEQGRLLDLIATPGSKLARELFPLGVDQTEASSALGQTVVDVTFGGGEVGQAVIARLARRRSLDVSILGAMIERIAGQSVGRTRLALPAVGAEAEAAIAELKAEGLIVDVLSGGAAASASSAAHIANPETAHTDEEAGR
ncbi:methionine ABC transporter ATP-binding protein [Pseudoclavibacter sp. CFCC 13611]|uniref:methionine ABC transporter ATP-binding protein n=1 Tax=Pseudoclavibacter sp. CFCC 13611 TaxID=2615178 RepID=UPI001300FF12|nr:ATP-binding cassette domain-containing protein [Pseudoclavibacter sp. CFCC 13611]KAB1663068.1 ATP-binding cassette domain-containing protein [Pseudoclavibacter sp. CFCC 13611]